MVVTFRPDARHAACWASLLLSLTLLRCLQARTGLLDGASPQARLPPYHTSPADAPLHSLSVRLEYQSNLPELWELAGYPRRVTAAAIGCGQV